MRRNPKKPLKIPREVAANVRKERRREKNKRLIYKPYLNANLSFPVDKVETKELENLRELLLDRLNQEGVFFFGLRAVQRAVEQGKVAYVFIAKDVSPPGLMDVFALICTSNDTPFTFLPNMAFEAGLRRNIRSCTAIGIRHLAFQADLELKEQCNKCKLSISPDFTALQGPLVDMKTERS
ncbi:hypothetical protein PCE1_002701 [Barthelona sp. PCE]